MELDKDVVRQDRGDNGVRYCRDAVDGHIDSHAGNHIGLHARKAALVDQVVNHVKQGVLGGKVNVLGTVDAVSLDAESRRRVVAATRGSMADWCRVERA